jgi:hypothetical protein
MDKRQCCQYDEEKTWCSVTHGSCICDHGYVSCCVALSKNSCSVMSRDEYENEQRV